MMPSSLVDRWDDPVDQDKVSRWDPAIERDKKAPEPDFTPTYKGSGASAGIVSGPTALRERMEGGKQAQERNEQARVAHYDKQIKDSGLGGNFDPSQDAIDFGTEFDIARSRNTKDIHQKFNEKYPEGDIVPTKNEFGDQAFLYRKSQQEPWKEYSPSFGTAAGKIATPQVAAGAAAGIATGGASALAQGAAVGGATFLGSLLNYGIEKLRGYAQDEGIGHAAVEAGVEGGIAGGVQGGVAALPAVGRYARKIADLRLSDLVRNKEYGKGFVTAAEEEGLPLPTAGQVTGDPIAQAKFKQVAGTSPVVRDTVETQKQGLKQALEKKVERDGFEGTHPDNLRRLMELQEAGLQEQLMESVPGGDFARVEGSQTKEAYKQGLDKYKQTIDAQRTQLGNSMENAFIQDDARFNVMPLKNAWEDLKQGVSATARDEAGKVKVLEPTPALKKIGDKIEQMNYEVRTTDGQSSFRQITALRDQLEKVSRTGSAEEKAMATDLLSKVDDVLQTPAGHTPRTQALLDQYNDLTKQHAEKLALFEGAGAGKGDILRPGNLSVVEAYKNARPNEFAQIANGFRTKLINQPDQIETTLKRFSNDQSVLRSFMSDEEQEAWKSYGRSWNAWKDQKIQRTLQAQNDSVQSSLDIIMGTKPEMGGTGHAATGAEISQMVSKIRGADSSVAGSLRAGIYQRLLDQATVTSESGGVRTLDGKKLVGAIDDLLSEESRRRLAPIMRPEDMQSLENFGKYALMIAKTKEGGQIQTSNLTAGITSPVKFMLHPERWLLGMAQLANNQRFAKILSEPVSSRLFMEAAEEGPTPKGIRLLAGASSTALRDLSKDTPPPEGSNSQ
jgi:hypothetical protein